MAAAALRGSGRGRNGSTRLNAVDCDIREVWICQPRASKVEAMESMGRGLRGFLCGFRLARGPVNNRDFGDGMGFLF
jgi:hypothetical protein